MKVKTKNKIYVQMRDLVKLVKILPILELNISSDFFEKLYDYSLNSSDNSFLFVEFNNTEEINFLDNLDFILDYYKYNHCKESSIIAEQIANRKCLDEIIKKYHGLSETEKKQYLKHYIAKIATLKFKIYSLQEIILFKQGKRDYVIPDKNLMKNTENLNKKKLNNFGKKIKAILKNN